MTTLAEYPGAVAAVLKTEIAGLHTSEAYIGQFKADGKKRLRFKVPAVFISVADAAVTDEGTGELTLDMTVNAHVMTGGAGTGRDVRSTSCFALAEAIALKANGQSWGLTGIGAAKVGRVTALASEALDAAGLALCGVRWTQKIRVGESIWDGGAAMPTTVYVSMDPKVGAGNEAHYEELTDA